MKPAIAVLFLVVFTCGASAPLESNIDTPEIVEPEDVTSLLSLIKNFGFVKKLVEKSGLTFDQIEMLFQKNVPQDLMASLYKLSPLLGKVLDSAAKNNVQLRVGIMVAKGQVPGIFDLFKIAGTPKETMSETILKAAAKFPDAQAFLEKVKDPQRNIPELWTLMTGRPFGSGNVLDSKSKAAGTSTDRVNKHLSEFVEMILVNFQTLQTALKDLATFPIDFTKVLHYLLILDYSPMQFGMDLSPHVNGGKYAITGNQLKHVNTGNGEYERDQEADKDIYNIMHELRVTYPAMYDILSGPNGNKEARNAVLHLIEEFTEVFSRLIGVKSTTS